MASTYTDRLGLELQANGENPNNWGSLLNSNVISLVDEAIAGYAVVSVSSVAVTLTDSDGTSDQEHYPLVHTGNLLVVLHLHCLLLQDQLTELIILFILQLQFMLLQHLT